MGIINLIKGKKGCVWNQDWEVRINLISEEKITIGEQLTRPEALKLYNQLKEKLKDKSDFIEVETENTALDEDNSLEFCIKKNILSIEVFQKD